MVALKAALAARAGLAGVQITLGLPYEPEGDFIALTDVEPSEQTAAGQRSTPHKREESFVLVVEISALRLGDADHTEAIQRAYVLLAELEDELRTDLTIDNSILNGWAVVEGVPMNTIGPGGEGRREALIRARVRCRARI